MESRLLKNQTNPLHHETSNQNKHNLDDFDDFAQGQHFMKNLHMKAYKLSEKINALKKNKGSIDGIAISSDGRKPLIPLFVTPPMLHATGQSYVKLSDTFTTSVSCTYQATITNDVYECNSTNFKSLTFDQCNVDVNYTYTIYNQKNQTVSVNKFIDEAFVDIIDQSQIVANGTEVSYERTEVIDICNNAEVTKLVVAISSFVDDAPNQLGEELPFTRSSISYETP